MLNNKIQVTVIVLVIVLVTVSHLTAQEFQGATVKYKQTARYDFFDVFKEFDSPEVDEWIASLPTQNQTDKILYLTPERALFTDNPEEKSVSPANLSEALLKAEYVQGPRADLLEVYTDFKMMEKIETIQFMTRFFRVSGPVQNSAWKLTNNMIKIHDYMCSSAEMKQGEDIWTAWFTPQIPVPAGPANHGGLPGLILALEKNGETVFYATGIDPMPPSEELVKKPEKGKKVTQEAFEEIRAAKIEEWKMGEEKGGEKKDYKFKKK